MQISLNLISTFRPRLMGLAILMVILYHLYCWSEPSPYLAFFRLGYAGVDIFLFLSGFGLCRSFESHSVLSFYWRRIVRIIPLYWLQLLVVFLSDALINSNLDFTKLFLWLTTASYWQADSFDWFIPALLVLYLLFPIVFQSVKRFPVLTTIIFCSIPIVVLHSFEIHWMHDCLYSRLPVFVFGAVSYFAMKENRDISVPMLILLLSFALSVSFDISKFLSAATILPWILFLAVILFEKPLSCKCKLGSFIEWCGSYSLELYIANGVNAFVLSSIWPTLESRPSLLVIVLTYIFSMVSLSSLTVLVSKLLKSLFSI